MQHAITVITIPNSQNLILKGGYYENVDATGARAGLLPVAAVAFLFLGCGGTYSPPATSDTYTITFNATGGAVSPVSGTTGADGKLSLLPTPTRSGYTFSGWYTSASSGTEVTGDYVFSGQTTIYAHWTVNSTLSVGGNN
jgi:uncharacterized repeat protein (TIGR02543 family)